MKSLIMAIAIVAVSVQLSNADLVTQTVASTGFTDAEGMADGSLVVGPGTYQLGFINAESNYSISNSASTGELNYANGNSERFQFGNSSLVGQSVAIGDMVILEVGELVITSDNMNDQVMGIGLSSGGVFPNSPVIAIGGQISRSGNDLFVENSALGIDAGRVDAGVDIGETFGYGITMTAVSAGALELATFDIEHQINGVSILTEFSQGVGTINAGAGNVGALSFVMENQDDAAGAAFSMGSLNFALVGTNSVPEPSSLGMLALCLLGCCGRRRK